MFRLTYDGERERERGSERERDSEWVKVKARTRRKGERNGATVRGDPRRSYAGTKPGQHLHASHANWRERSDISTFYFTRFPEDAMQRRRTFGSSSKSGGMYGRSSSPNKETKGGGGTAS